ncbi:MAG: recombinase family protein [Bradyrhizobium sp.]|nr:recombinase family protein [Bradyrhizobium sp.]
MIAKTKQKETLLPAVGYVRMSTDAQEDSPDQQKAALTRFAADKNYRIVRWYVDEGISGDAAEKRKAFQAMIRDAATKKDFQVILCFDYGRFGRFDSIEAGRWIDPLRKAGVKLVTMGEGEIDWDTFTGRVMNTLYAEGKHEFLRSLAHGSIRGKAAKAKEGYYVGGIAPRGYDRVLVDGAGQERQRIPRGQRVAKPADWHVELRISEDEEEVELVRWMFNTFLLRDMSLRAIAAELNRRGVKTTRNCTWSHDRVRELLGNPVYGGRLAWNRSSVAKYYGFRNGRPVERRNLDWPKNRKRAMENTPDDWVVFEDPRLAIVSPKTWEAVQRKLKQRAEVGSKAGIPCKVDAFPLSGLVYCAHCGGKMHGREQVKPTAKGPKTYRWHVCSNFASKGICAKRTISEPELVEVVTDAVLEHVIGPEAVERFARQFREKIAEQSEKAPADAARLAKRLMGLDTNIAKAVRNMMLIDDVATLAAMQSELARMREERNAVAQQLPATNGRPAGKGDAKKMLDEALAELGRLGEGLKSDDPSLVRATFQALVERIDLTFEDVTSDIRTVRKFQRGVIQFRHGFLVDVPGASS